MHKEVFTSKNNALNNEYMHTHTLKKKGYFNLLTYILGF